MLARPDILLSAILVGNNFANILASSVVTIIFIDYFGGNVLVGSVILTIVILIFSGFSSGSETGMMASNKVKLRHNSKKSRGARRALRLLARPDILLSAILVGNNFANILASSVVTIIFIDYFGGNVLVGSVILTIVILIFSEITPKTIATVYPEKFAEKSSWILKGLVFFI